MSATPNCCTHCGEALAQGNRFCPKCGKAVEAPAPQAPQAPQAPPSGAPPKQGGVKGCLGRIGLVLLGLALIAFAARGPALGVAGQATTAVVTEVKQVVSQTSDKMDHNYSVLYRFTANGGSTHSGSMSMSKVYNATKLPREGSTLRIRYLKSWPAINAAEKQCGVTLAVLLGVVGIVLIVFAVKPRKAKG